MNQDLNKLRQGLRAALNIRAETTLNQLPTASLRRLETVRRQLSPPRGHRSDERIARALLSFRMLREKTPFPDIKYACYGIARTTDWGGRTLLDEPVLFNMLLNLINELPSNGRRQRWCKAGLISAWKKDIEPAMGNIKNPGMNHLKLRDYLEQPEANLPTWLNPPLAPLRC